MWLLKQNPARIQRIHTATTKTTELEKSHIFCSRIKYEKKMTHIFCNESDYFEYKLKQHSNKLTGENYLQIYYYSQIGSESEVMDLQTILHV